VGINSRVIKKVSTTDVFEILNFERRLHFQNTADFKNVFEDQLSKIASVYCSNVDFIAIISKELDRI